MWFYVVFNQNMFFSCSKVIIYYGFIYFTPIGLVDCVTDIIILSAFKCFLISTHPLLVELFEVCAYNYFHSDQIFTLQEYNYILAISDS